MNACKAWCLMHAQWRFHLGMSRSKLAQICCDVAGMHKAGSLTAVITQDDFRFSGNVTLASVFPKVTRMFWRFTFLTSRKKSEIFYQGLFRCWAKYRRTGVNWLFRPPTCRSSQTSCTFPLQYRWPRFLLLLPAKSDQRKLNLRGNRAVKAGLIQPGPRAIVDAHSRVKCDHRARFTSNSNSTAPQTWQCHLWDAPFSETWNTVFCALVAFICMLFFAFNDGHRKNGKTVTNHHDFSCFGGSYCGLCCLFQNTRDIGPTGTICRSNYCGRGATINLLFIYIVVWVSAASPLLSAALKARHATVAVAKCHWGIPQNKESISWQLWWTCLNSGVFRWQKYIFFLWFSCEAVIHHINSPRVIRTKAY